MEIVRKRQSIASGFQNFNRPRKDDTRSPSSQSDASGGALPWGAEMFYCCDCFMLCGLDEIIMDGAHKTHCYIYAVEQANIVLQEVQKQAGCAHAAMPEFLARMAHVRSRMVEMTEVADNLEQRIIDKFSSLIQRISERRDVLVGQLHTMKNTKLKALDELATSMQGAFDRASQAFDELSELSKEVDATPPYVASPAMKAMNEKNEKSETKSETTTTKSRPAMRFMEENKNKIHQGVLRKAPTKKQSPPMLSPYMQQYVRNYLPLTQALSMLQSGSTDAPELDQIDLFFRETLSHDIDKYGKLSVHEGGFRTASRSNYGAIHMPYIVPTIPEGDAEPNPNVHRGLIHWLGTRGWQTDFRNPCQAGMMKIKCSTLFEVGQPGLLAGMEEAACLTKNQKHVYVEISAGSKMSFALTHIMLRHGAANHIHGTCSLIVEGLQKEAIDEEPAVLVETSGTSFFSEPFKENIFPVHPPSAVAFKAFRVRMTGVNNNTDPSQSWKLCLSGIELYGSLYCS